MVLSCEGTGCERVERGKGIFLLQIYRCSPFWKLLIGIFITYNHHPPLFFPCLKQSKSFTFSGSSWSVLPSRESVMSSMTEKMSPPTNSQSVIRCLRCSHASKTISTKYPCLTNFSLSIFACYDFSFFVNREGGTQQRHASKNYFPKTSLSHKSLALLIHQWMNWRGRRWAVGGKNLCSPSATSSRETRALRVVRWDTSRIVLKRGI